MEILAQNNDHTELQLFGKNIKLLRDKYNTTQSALAAATGISRNTLSAIEQGERDNNFNWNTLQALANYFNYEVGVLINSEIEVIFNDLNVPLDREKQQSNRSIEKAIPDIDFQISLNLLKDLNFRKQKNEIRIKMFENALNMLIHIHEKQKNSRRNDQAIPDTDFQFSLNLLKDLNFRDQGEDYQEKMFENTLEALNKIHSIDS